jgi:hypothetical protein
MAQSFALGDAAAALAVEPHGMDLVEIGHGAMSVRDVAQLGDSVRCRRSSNRPTRKRPVSACPARASQVGGSGLPGRCAGISASARRCAECPIIEAWLPSSDSTTQPGRRVAECRAMPVRHVAAGEQQRCLPCEADRQFPLQHDVVMARARDVARAAGAGAAPIASCMAASTAGC